MSGSTSCQAERKQEPIIFMTLAPAFYNDQNYTLLPVNVFSLKLMHMSSQQINSLSVFYFYSDLFRDSPAAIFGRARLAFKHILYGLLLNKNSNIHISQLISLDYDL